MFRISMFILATVFYLNAAAFSGEAEEAFVVHEWGVMIKEKTTQGTRLSPADALFDSLPKFVVKCKNVFTPQTIHRAWRKPVLHFYGPDQTRITVQVLTAKGRPLYYWPNAELLTETFWFMSTGKTEAVGMTWNGKLTKQAPANVPSVPEGHWWNKARTIPGLYLSTAAGNERFIFYEGTAFQEPVVSASITQDAIIISNAYTEKSAAVVLIIKDGSSLYLQVIPEIAGKGSLAFKKEDILKNKSSEDSILKACRKQWTGSGMTEKEAAAIVDIWRDDLTGREGFLLISSMPRKIYDGMFPLKITPEPAELVRVGMVFDTLDGEPARTDWLTVLPETIKGLIGQLDDDDFKVRNAATTKLMQLGDLAEGALTLLVNDANTEPEARMRANMILKALVPLPVKPLAKNAIKGLKSSPGGGLLIKKQRAPAE